MSGTAPTGILYTANNPKAAIVNVNRITISLFLMLKSIILLSIQYCFRVNE
jgi:hypothetical protein